MTEKIDWDNLPSTVKVWVETTERLPEGVYACPRCEGTGRIQVGHADPCPNPTVKCGMCMGTKRIKRCGKCQENPVPSDSVLGLCKECEDYLMQRVLDLEKHIEIVCTFPKESGICAHSECQECNSNGKLVCDLKGCEYATLPLTVFPEECIVRKVNGEDYCNTCVDKEFCPWKNNEQQIKENIKMEPETEDIRKEHQNEFEEEERLYQAEQQLEETKKAMKGERVEEPPE